MQLNTTKSEISLCTEISPYFSSMHAYTKAFFIKGFTLIPLDVNHDIIKYPCLHLTSPGKTEPRLQVTAQSLWFPEQATV